MKNRSFHSKFQINGHAFVTEKDILTYSKDFLFHQFLCDWFSEDEYVTVNTSGSTGKPKPIQLRKEFMKNSAKATGNFFGLFEKTTALLCLSTDYIAGKMMLVRALTLGWKLDVVAPVSNPLENVDKRYDFSAMVPMQLRNSLPNLHKVKKLIVGGGVVSNDLIENIQNHPTEIYATYGMTETITHIAVKKLNNIASLSAMSDDRQKVEKSSYKALPSIKFSTDERNCLVIEAPKISDSIVVTNDVVHLISTTQFEWLGRYDNVINSGGVKLHPEKIEEKLSRIIKGRFFVTRVKDHILGEKLILIVEGKKYDVILTKVENLSKYEIPKEIYFVETFVETATKKIQRTKTLDLIDSLN